MYLYTCMISWQCCRLSGSTWNTYLMCLLLWNKKIWYWNYLNARTLTWRSYHSSATKLRQKGCNQMSRKCKLSKICPTDEWETSVSILVEKHGWVVPVVQFWYANIFETTYKLNRKIAKYIYSVVVIKVFHKLKALLILHGTVLRTSDYSKNLRSIVMEIL